jgi:hypothetical protein
MKIILQPGEEHFATIGEGKSFGAAAYDLIQKVISDYAVESLSDGILFAALGELQEKGEYKYFDFSCPEQSFELTLED